MSGHFLITFIFLLLPSMLNAQITFSDQIIIQESIAKGVVSIFSADLDGDGDNDILSASRSDNKIAWYENIDSQGTFGIQKVISANAESATCVFAADIDGDGDFDVLSSSCFDDKIAWYENTNGLADFSDEKIISTSASAAWDIYVSDLDNDSDLDVIAASPGNDEIAWYENIDGDGTFSPKKVISTSADGANQVYAKDLDGDNDLDVVSVSDEDHEITWYENINTWINFWPRHEISHSATFVETVFSGDIDSDGDNDIISIAEDSNKIAWYENVDGEGNFDDIHIITSSTNVAKYIYATDIDSDGDIDIIAGLDEEDKIVWYENLDGLGNFGEQNVITTEVKNVQSLYPIDIDGDNDLDIISGSSSDCKVAWYENLDGEGSFGQQHILTNSANFPTTVIAADLDGDLDTDVISASEFDDKIAWYENEDGCGSFLGQNIITTSVESANCIHTVDLDNDGDLDILSIYRTGINRKIVWFKNVDGFAHFSDEIMIADIIGNGEKVYASDIDNDGDKDILYTYSHGVTRKNVWFENTNGLGTFSGEKYISTPSWSFTEIISTDLNNDGNMDILFASVYTDKIVWIKNTDGNGTFSDEITITDSARFVLAIYAADLDGDNDMDVISYSSSDQEVAWYENIDENDTFGPQQVISSSDFDVRSIYAEDLDNDGDFEILTASRSENTISYYENIDGAGTFGDRQIITSNAEGARTVYASDLDNDGDIDILSGSCYDSKIAWYKNMLSETGIINFETITADHFHLEQNFPNPFNPQTTISFTLKENSYVTLKIFDIKGRLIQQLINSTYKRGKYKLNFNGSNIPSGLYFYQLKTNKYTDVKKMILLE